MTDLTLRSKKEHYQKMITAEIICPHCGEKDPERLIALDQIEQLRCDTCGKLFMPWEEN